MQTQPAAASQKARRKKWEAKWSRDDFDPAWAGRGLPKEIREPADPDWIPEKGRVLDIGCGLGEITAYYASRGYEALGIDFAESAVAKARAAHEGQPNLEFMAVDITDVAKLNGREFDLLIDRGCLHTIPRPLIPAYIRSVAQLSADGARMLLFIRAFRKQNRITRLLCGEQIEWRCHIRNITKWFHGIYRIDAVAHTSLGRPADPKSTARMPGLVFHLVKEPS